GLYRAMTAGPVTPKELAAKTETSERYVREWLNGQAAAGYVEYDPSTGRYVLPEASAACLTDDDSPACVLGAFQGMTAAMRAAPRRSSWARRSRARRSSGSIITRRRSTLLASARSAPVSRGASPSRPRRRSRSRARTTTS